MLQGRLSRLIPCLFVPFGLLLNSGCVTHTNEIQAADLAMFTSTGDEQIEEILARRPASDFPITLAVARIQRVAPSPWRAAQPSAAAHLVTTRDEGTENALATLLELPQIEAIVPLSGALLSGPIEGEEDLRRSAARLQADMLLVYTIGTQERVDDRWILLQIATLGLLPPQKMHTDATASAVLIDTRTGFVYGLTERSAHDSTWTLPITSLRMREEERHEIEQESFHSLIAAFEGLWGEVLRELSAGA